MKICEIIASQGKGGLENHFVDLCNGLASRGHEVHVIASPLFSGHFDSSITIHKIPLHWSRRNPLLLFRLYRALKQITPDIVHTHASKGAELLASIKRFFSYPVISTIHNIKKRISGYIEMDAVIGVSQGLLNQFPHPRKRVIYNGLNLSGDIISKTALRSRFNLPANRPIAISIGRLVEAKDFAMLIDAWQGINADLLIIGDGPLQSSLQSQLEALNLESTVHLTGFIDKASTLISAADLVIISSEREGFNYVLAEALLQSKPVLSTDVPAPNEVLPKHYLVPIADSRAMHNKIQHCIANLDSVNNDFQELYQRAKETFTLDSMVISTERYLGEVIQDYSKRKHTI
ncbi:MAG: glycosyltransferase [Gammaproteobacteria bacterium]|nr:glycosyltransferase [Gammaproteobacteria bacterium]